MKKSWIISTSITISLLFLLFFTTSKNIVDEIKVGLDLQGGFEILYEVQEPYEGREIPEEKLVTQMASLISDRINLLGISEPVITIEDDDRIRVQVPGVKDQEEAREFISIGGNITFRDTDDQLVLSSSDFSAVKIEKPSEDSSPNISIDFTESVDMESITKKYEGKKLVLWLDYVNGDSYKEATLKIDSKIIYEGMVKQTWSSSGMSLSSDFSKKEAEIVAKALTTGDLPAPLIEISSQSVSAKLGEKSLNQTLISGIIAIFLVFSYMVWRYRFLGLVSILCMLSYLYLTIGLFVFFEGVLTLTGLAAFILGLGIAVDATIITFERLKEEVKPGKSFLQTVMDASNRTFVTIGDAQLTTLITAAGLFVFGVGSVKGFATMLLISIVSGFLTCYALLRLLLYMIGESRVVEWYESRK
ncbi:protein translocase subunit SecD [Pseudalkalibacillus hwajinpoensis]|uniref:Protein translocase subunit SecD n=1 Tax=Guptibacillus hwajinpoensis TaxID=208199 RepID=A0A4U1MP87_9BACL|nr:protein translocase subunit SecD [Pseudalkalibacillus hwajinpoensis]TKD72330.1 protein translocase subunit SecD [Pseudalkalibacillus hwajinpoensis]